MPHHLLVVDDDPLIRSSLVRLLEAEGYVVSAAADGSAARAAIEERTPDVALLDHHLPDTTGLDVLRFLHAREPRTPVLMFTGEASLDGAVRAVKSGAYDYLPKPLEPEHVLGAVARALETYRLREQVARQEELSRRELGDVAVVAESPTSRRIVQLVRRVARSEASTILFTGESGVGKGVLARLLHAAGAGRTGPFMNITCTALSAHLLESELFGHERGAFTDARDKKRGLLELADGGTAFLDEIGDLSPNLQGKLIRFLEDKTFRRVGGTRDVEVSVRIVAATNKDLAVQVEEGSFRRDLYYRLKVIPIEIPPLRERREDVLPLAHAFVAHFNREFQKNVAGIEDEAAERMHRYDWPGNVRELRNAIERAVLLTEGEWLGIEDLPAELGGEPRDLDGVNGHEPPFILPSAGIALEDVERSLVEQALSRTSGNRTGAARLLGLNRDQVRYRIEKYGLNGDGADG